VAWAIIDTSVYVGHWERGLHDDLLAEVRKGFVIRHSAVVLSELRRGARTREAERRVAGLFRLAQPCWEPSVSDWWEAGHLIRSVGDAEGWETAKRRDFQNDALIGLTARRQGAVVVTANWRDFDVLAEELGITVIGP